MLLSRCYFKINETCRPWPRGSFLIIIFRLDFPVRISPRSATAISVMCRVKDLFSARFDYNLLLASSQTPLSWYLAVAEWPPNVPVEDMQSKLASFGMF